MVQESALTKKKRLRVFAGPNGSGKSTFIEKFPIEPNIKLGIYINADEIEKSIYEKGYIELTDFKLDTNTIEVQAHFKQSKFSPLLLDDVNLYAKFHVTDNKLFYENYKKRNSYVSSDLADFFRKILVKRDFDFSFESVMSDFGKVKFLEEAKNLGFQNYLYFFCTDDVEININRVEIRVKQRGHSVDPEKIRKRYKKSLENLKPALKYVHRAYFFDNSGDASQLIAEYFEEQITVINSENVPRWFYQYVYLPSSDSY